MNMEMNKIEGESLGVNRRDFLKSGSFATLMTMMGGVQLLAQTNTPATGIDMGAGPHINVAVIGLGAWGREILNVLGRIPQAEVTGLCDTYGASLRRSASAAPKATQAEDFKAILDNKTIKAVIIATPTHQHKDLVLAALKAGKHVYCEAPLAHTIEDARAIALAARDAKTQIFQAGLQMRSDPQRHFLLPFIRSGALGESVMARAQWHKKQSWRSASPNPDREKALNWRLQKETSLGLIGEIGVHQLDQACWFLNAQPVSIVGYGAISLWKDGREVFDTIQTIVEFPNNVRWTYDCTLANSFDADYEMFYGTHAAVMMRENKAWMFKEVDSPLLGWEVYAKRNSFFRETGIALVAGASKQENLEASITAAVPLESTPLYNALLTFIRNSAQVNAAGENFIADFGADDPAALREHLLGEVGKRRYAAGFAEGFQAAVMAIKANEAVRSGQRVVFQKEWLELT
jgi:predicted dehydrogenase